MIVSKYSGAGWIEKAYKLTCSPFGRDVANLLGVVVQGIYHLDHRKTLRDMDWGHPSYISIRWPQDELATFDANLLTRLVILAHDAAIRVAISPSSWRHLLVEFHRREREGSFSVRHPSLEEAVDLIRFQYSIEDSDV